MAAKGILYMIPCPISDATEVGDVTPAANGRIIDTLDYFIVENVRSARRFLARAKIARRIDDLEFVELNEHTRREQVAAMIDPIERGRSAGVISEAGMPGVADPGALAAAECHRRGIRVVPLVGLRPYCWRWRLRALTGSRSPLRVIFPSSLRSTLR